MPTTRRRTTGEGCSGVPPPERDPHKPRNNVGSGASRFFGRKDAALATESDQHGGVSTESVRQYLKAPVRDVRQVGDRARAARDAQHRLLRRLDREQNAPRKEAVEQ